MFYSLVAFNLMNGPVKWHHPPVRYLGSGTCSQMVFYFAVWNFEVTLLISQQQYGYFWINTFMCHTLILFLRMMVKKKNQTPGIFFLNCENRTLDTFKHVQLAKQITALGSQLSYTMCKSNCSRTWADFVSFFKDVYLYITVNLIKINS